MTLWFDGSKVKISGGEPGTTHPFSTVKWWELPVVTIYFHKQEVLFRINNKKKKYRDIPDIH